MKPRGGMGPVPVVAAPALAVAALGFDPETVAQLRRLLASPSPARLQSDLPAYLGDDAEAGLAAAAPDICLIDFDREPGLALGSAERIRRLLPQAAIFAVSAAAEPDRILAAMRSGCTEYLRFPLDPAALAEAVARLGGRHSQDRPRRLGHVLLFSGTKGGCGVTTIVTHAGAMLAQSCGLKTLLIDLHPTLGDAALALGLTHQSYDVFELADNLERLDDDLLQSFLLPHPSGLALLPAPTGAEARAHLSSTVAPEALGQVLDFVRRRFDVVLVDCPPGLDAASLELLPRADQLVLVTLAEIPALRNLVSCLDYLKRGGHGDFKIQIVLNRHLRRCAIGEGQITRAIRREIDLKVPNRYEELMKTAGSGDPVASLPNSEVARAVMEWARKVAAACAPPAAPAAAKPRFFGLWGRR